METLNLWWGVIWAALTPVIHRESPQPFNVDSSRLTCPLPSPWNAVYYLPINVL